MVERTASTSSTTAESKARHRPGEPGVAMCCDEFASLGLQLHHRRHGAERETEKASLPGACGSVGVPATSARTKSGA